MQGKRAGVVMLWLLAAGCGGRSGAPADAATGPRTLHTSAGTASTGSGSTGAVDDTGADLPEGVISADITLTTSDGVELAATYVAGAPDVPRCVVLVHQLSSTRAEWSPVVAALAGRYHVLTFDLRGHGASTQRKDGSKLDWHDFGAAEWADTSRDLDAAREFFAAMQIGTDACVYVGSSIGATAVLRFAGKYFDLAGVALLSPGLKYRGLDVMPAAKQFHNPAFIVNSGETGPAEAAELLARMWAKEDATHRVERFIAHGSAHGMKMTADDPDLVPALVSFIVGAIGKL